MYHKIIFFSAEMLENKDKKSQSSSASCALLVDWLSSVIWTIHSDKFFDIVRYARPFVECLTKISLIFTIMGRNCIYTALTLIEAKVYVVMWVCVSSISTMWWSVVLLRPRHKRPFITAIVVSLPPIINIPLNNPGNATWISGLNWQYLRLLWYSYIFLFRS